MAWFPLTCISPASCHGPKSCAPLGLRAYWRRRGAVGVPSRVPVKVGLEGQRHRSCSSTITRLGDGAVTVRVRSASRVRLPEVPRTLRR